MAQDETGTGRPRSFAHQPGDDLAVALRIAAGGRLTLDLHPAGGYAFPPLESSGPLVAQITEHAGGGGGVGAAPRQGCSGGASADGHVVVQGVRRVAGVVVVM